MKAIFAMTAAALFSGASAHATVVVSFGGINSSDGTTTRFTTDAAHTTPVQYESFDTFSSPGSTDPSTCFDTGSYETANYIDASGNSSLPFAQPNTDQRGVHLAPKGGAGCYVAVGTTGVLDLTSNTGVPVTYIGFLLGSPDSYNRFQLLDVNGSLINNSFGGLADSNGVLHGDALIRAATGSYTTDPGNAGTVYVNFTFTADENVGGIEISNSGNCCTEIDNSVVTTDPVFDPNAPKAALRPALVPEPTAALALLTAMGLLGLARRKRC